MFVAAAARLSPPLRDAFARIGPLWLPERADRGLAYQLARSIVGQQLSTKAARSIWARIEAAAAGRPLATYLCEEHAEAIRACGVSRNKVKALLSIGAAAAQGTLDGPLLRAMSPAVRSDHLRKLWGVGQWTVDMASIFYFREPDIWPLGDIAVQTAFARFTGRRKPEKAAGAFAPYRSILALYMWEIIDRVPDQEGSDATRASK